MDQYKIAELIFLELQNKLSEEERTVLNNWITQEPENRIVYEKIVNEENLKKRMEAYDKLEIEKFWNRFDAKINEKEKVRRLGITTIMKYAAAILIPVLITTYIYTQREKIFPHKEITQTISVLPGTQRAILTTADNKKIELGQTSNKRVFNFGKTVVTDTSDILTYINPDMEDISSEPETVFNSLETPKGGEYTIILSDWTKVFLNAETKLTFPKTFNGKTREVTLKGEAYFEVTKNESQPFIVKTEDYDIRVYGTSFNVSAYQTDNLAHTTLVEGSVEIIVHNSATMKLIPGQQAAYNKSTKKIYKREVETYLYTDWKDGLFAFDNESLENILFRLSRWYDFNTEFSDSKLANYHFSGTLNRYDELDKVLDMVALTTNVSFEIKSDLVIIKEK
jgi:transmembrane sensor